MSVTRTATTRELASFLARKLSAHGGGASGGEMVACIWSLEEADVRDLSPGRPG